jgi:diphosphomevalonate decarboxylase
MPESFATAISHPNIALIKYWGDLDPDLHIPANGSISMSMQELQTRTSVEFESSLRQDELYLNGVAMQGGTLERVQRFLKRVREMAEITRFARVDSQSNFPVAAGLASSASGFAALSLSASKAAGVDLDEPALSRLARTGSGSACRSIPAGFVEWHAGRTDLDSYAFSIAPPEHWELVDCITLVNQAKKTISSSLGHALASSSPLQQARLADAPRRLNICRQAILDRDFDRLTEIVELDSNLMHAVMLTSTPPLIYWQPATVAVMQAVQKWRKEGLAACYTIDAGPNVHVLCPMQHQDELVSRLKHIDGVSEVLIAHPGGPARLVDDPLAS